MTNGSSAMAGRGDRRMIELVELISTTDPFRSRLQAALIDVATAIQTARDREATASVNAPGRGETLQRVDELFAQGCVAASRQDRYVAYDCLQQIHRELVETMPPAERAAIAKALKAEAREKLTGWRKQSAEELAATLCDEPDPSVAALRQLMLIIHQSQQNKQHKLLLLTRHSRALAAITAAAILGPLLVAYLGMFDWIDRTDPATPIWRVLVAGVLVGVLGGVFSMLVRHQSGGSAARIPELREGWWISVLRPLIGGTAAIPIVLLMESGSRLLGEPSPALLLGACFAGGFSERWFVAQVEGLVGAGGSGGKG